MDFSTKNPLKPLELTFLTSIYHQFFKLIKKLILSCLIEYSDFFVGMFRDVSCYLHRSRYNFNGFFKQKFIETTRTDIFDMLLSSGFKLIKKLILSCLIEYSDFFVGMFRDVSCYLHRSRYNFNGFFKQKFIETTRTDISKLLLSSRF